MDNATLTEVLKFLGVGLGSGGLGGYLTYRASRKKDQENTSLALINTLLGRITKLEDANEKQQHTCDEKIEVLQKAIDDQQKEIFKLQLEIQKLTPR